MKKCLSLTFILASLLSASLSAQIDSTKKVAGTSFNFGIGIGIDYGGIGTRLTVVPGRNVMAFAGIGYNFAGVGVNGGLGYLFIPDKRTCPYLIGMYGYNAVIVIQNASQYDQSYYGPSMGLGIQFRNRELRNYFNLELLVPFRPQEYSDDLDRLKLNPQIKIDSEPPPVAFSFGYHFG